MESEEKRKSDKKKRRNRSLSFDQVFEEELTSIDRRRNPREDVAPEHEGSPADHKHNLFGVALSGGGIRSATFNLGFLQALCRYRLLKRLDYLSMVSGGGYIGGWLAAWISREGIDAVQEQLGRKASDRTADVVESPAHRLDEGDEFLFSSLSQLRSRSEETPESSIQTIEPEAYPISHLRRYSNYLTPKVGLFSVNTWEMVATYARNFILNLMVIALASTAMVYLVRATAEASRPFNPDSLPKLPLFVAGVLIVFAAITTFYNLSRPALVEDRSSAETSETDMSEERTHQSRWKKWAQKLTQKLTQKWAQMWAQKWIQNPFWTCAIPLIIASVLVSKIGKEQAVSLFAIDFELPLIGVPDPKLVMLVWSVLVWFGLSVFVFRRHLSNPVLLKNQSKRGRQQETVALLFCVSVWTSVILVASLYYALKFLSGENETTRVLLGTPLMVGVILLTNVAFIGASGRLMTEEQRHRLSKLGALLLIGSVLWLLLVGIVEVVPDVIRQSEWKVIAAVLLSLLILPILSLADSPVDDDSTRRGLVPGLAKRAFAVVAPPVFIFSFFALNAYIALPMARAYEYEVFQLFDMGQVLAEYELRSQLLTGFLLMMATDLLARRIDVNTFSMHNFYRSQLVRAFLGASRGSRPADPNTDFSRSDDVPLVQLSREWKEQGTSMYAGPIPIFNCALNLGGSSQLSLQERKADSFTFTPYHFGYHHRVSDPELIPDRESASSDGSPRKRYFKVAEAAYRHTKRFPKQLTTGMAMAISGAAISSNMGSRTTAPLAFLLTVFNVRLGAWIANPHRRLESNLLSPKYGFMSLFTEMLARTDQNANFVYLSDGGHFENLGAYELIRRRCRYVVVVDAGADPGMTFSDLGNLIRKCRSDFGVNIEIDVADIKPTNDGYSRSYFAVGRIRYDQTDDRDQPGLLVYVKSSLTGQETVDIAAYKREHKSFPHQSTLDQWFTESQFDSYRALGYQIGDAVFRSCGTLDTQDMPLESFFSHLRRAAFPSSQRILENFTSHAKQLQSLLSDLSDDERLSFLDRQLFPDSSRVDEKGERILREDKDNQSIPSRHTDFRNGFYFCNRLIQLMENVFIDLNLDKESGHPDNRGWRNLFGNWAGSDMLRLTWSISASTYGARYQKICKDKLGLNLDGVRGNRLEIQGLDSDDVQAAIFENTSLTPKERTKIIDMLGKRAGSRVDDIAPIAGFWSFVIEVEIKRVNNSDQTETYRLPCGFAFVDDRNRLVFMRLRDHLRGLGLGRRALEDLRRQDQLPSRTAPEARSLYEAIAMDRERGRNFELMLNSMAHAGAPDENEG